MLSLLNKYWHYRLGHLNNQMIDLLARNKLINSSCNRKLNCEACVVEKSHNLPHKRSNSVYSSPLALMFVNIWGSTQVISIEGYRYYINFVDSYSNYNWVYPLY